MAGSHGLFVALFLVALVLRAWVVTAYKPAFFFSDAYAYIQRSVTMSPSGSFHPFLYPLMIKPFLLLENLAAIALAQHVAGLVLGVMIYILLRRIGLSGILAGLATIPVFFDGYQLLFEHNILSEIFFQLALVGALTLLLWKTSPTVPTAMASGVLLGVASLIRFVGLAGLVSSLIYLLMWRRRGPNIVAFIGAFLLVLGVYSVWFQSHSDQYTITNRNGFFLYGRVVSFANCTEMVVPKRLEAFCPRNVKRRTQGLFTSGLPDRIRQDPGYNARALDFSKRAIAAQPEEYARVVLTDFGKYFVPARPEERDRPDRKWLFPRSLDTMRIHKVVARTGEAPPPGSGIPLRFQVNEDLANRLRAYQDVVWIRGPLLALLLLAGLIGGGVRLLSRRDLRVSSAAILVSLTTVGVLLFPPVFAVYHFRYTIPALPLSAFAGMLGLHALLSRPKSLPSQPSEARI